MPDVVFVIPWFGKEIAGGAETECRRSARQLQQAGFDVEIWATCIRDFRSPWVDFYRPGVESVDGIPVRRFRTAPRNATRFDYVNIKLMHGLPVTTEEEHWYIADSARSLDLERAIARAPADVRFIFLPYLFGTTYWGSQVRPADSFLMPCLHDEVYAHLGIFRPMFQRVRGCLFLTRPERALARRLYDLPAERCHLIGASVEETPTGDPAAFRRRFGIHQPFLLYVGRKDPGKNIDQLIAFFRRYRRARASDLILVCLGAGSLPATALGPDVVDLGFVSEQEKADACAAAIALCNPSRNESFSFVLMEAWLAGTPVLVNGHCAVTRDHCLASNGGLFYTDYLEFAACVDWLIAHPAERQRMAALGREYVRRNFAPKRVLARLQAAILG